MIFKWKYIRGKVKLFREILLSRLNLQTDFAGYNLLIEYIKRNKLYNLKGDVVEIGAFMGGGTRKLGEFFREFEKKVIVVDIFDPSLDQTKNERGESMASIYNKILGNRDLSAIFNKNVAHLQNLVVNRIDSRKMVFGHDVELCFSMIDGSHDPLNVENDFKLVWSKTVAGGTVALHDYGGDLPQVTKTIDHLIEIYSTEIERIEKFPKQCFIFMKRGENNDDKLRH